jgi:hypothetical protein
MAENGAIITVSQVGAKAFSPPVLRCKNGLSWPV